MRTKVVAIRIVFLPVSLIPLLILIPGQAHQTLIVEAEVEINYQITHLISDILSIIIIYIYYMKQFSSLLLFSLLILNAFQIKVRKIIILYKILESY